MLACHRRSAISLSVRKRVLGIFLCAVLLLVIVLPTSAAGVLAVDTLVDEADGSCIDGDCSLRDALALASPYSTILFGVNGTIKLASTLIIDKDVVIMGPGDAEKLVLDGQHNVQVMQITADSTHTVTITGLTIANGSSGGSAGGGLSNSNITGGSHLILAQVTFADNASDSDGGGLYSNGLLTINDSLFAGNSASNGGAIYQSIKSGDISRTTFRNNHATSNDAGGVYFSPLSVAAALAFSDCTFAYNTAARSAGAFHNGNAADSSLTRCMFINNSAGDSGDGGAISNDGKLSIDRSLLLSNTAGSAATSNNRGGAIYTAGPLDLTNTTLAKNSARAAGGAIYFGEDASGLLTNVTVSGNTLFGPGSAAGVYTGSAAITAKNTLISSNTPGGECSGNPFTSDSVANLASDATCSPGFTQVTSADLALKWQLTYYLPAHGSPAIDAGSAPDCPLVDQRGWSRPVDEDGSGGAVCDIGAIEATPYFGLVYLPLMSN